jgi:protein-S-isoprenylcysteine O-methyltransferase Ste14
MYLLDSYSAAFIITTLIWAGLESGLLLRDRKVASVSGKANGRSLYFILISAFLACLLLSTYTSLHISIDQDNRLLAGTLIIWLGLFIRWWAIVSLGKCFRIVVNLLPGQKLIQNGPYKYMRHPSYTGSLLIFFGFGLGLGNWMGLAVMFILPLITFMLRVGVEEKVLVSTYGADYLTYMRKTARFIPFVV